MSDHLRFESGKVLLYALLAVFLLALIIIAGASLLTGPPVQPEKTTPLQISQSPAASSQETGKKQGRKRRGQIGADMSRDEYDRKAKEFHQSEKERIANLDYRAQSEERQNKLRDEKETIRSAIDSLKWDADLQSKAAAFAKGCAIWGEITECTAKSDQIVRQNKQEIVLFIGYSCYADDNGKISHGAVFMPANLLFENGTWVPGDHWISRPPVARCQPFKKTRNQ